MADKPFTLRVQLAVMDSDLPKEVRHLVHVMAVLAEHDTGEGWHGQETIARHMGCTDRHVRRLMLTLEDPNSSGVHIERKPRFHRDGRGRTSDWWKLMLTTTNRNSVPPEQRSAGQPRPTNRTSTTDQPEQRSGDLRSDLRSELRSIKSTKRAKPSKWKFVPEDWQIKDSHRTLARRLGVDVDAQASKYRDHEFDKPKTDPDRAFNTWLRNAAEWSKSNGKGRLPPAQQGMAAHVKEGTL